MPISTATTVHPFSARDTQSNTAPQAKGRVFWLGYHKVLKYTELPRLRRLGFEVFNPRYISAVYDQSAYRLSDFDQSTTLPPEVFRRLMSYYFFHLY